MHRMDQIKLDEVNTARTAIAAAITRLQQIEAGASTATTAQMRTAIADMAKYMRHIIKIVTG